LPSDSKTSRWLAVPYALWAFGAFLVLGLAVLMLILPVPWQSLRRRMVRRAAQTVLSACRMRLTVRHLEHLPKTPCVVVANHSSYLDGVVLFAALPPVFGFVIKREMSRVPLANLLLRRIGSHFVDRGRGGKSARDTRKLLKRANAGGALAFFPEGTFNAKPGLAEFRSGAFVVAALSELPIVPIAIRGTRTALPAGTVLPRPAGITVELAPAIAAPASTSGAHVKPVVREARLAILARIAEPDLAPEQVAAS
jgi:1-acyl-sn-glycerol-3-phosphate acyltransferase